MKKSKQSILHYKGVSYVMPFILITVCFALWGFANDITNPMVKAFSKIFRMSVTDGALVQVAFYGGYFAMAFPAAVFIRKYSYKAGVLLGLGLYAVGALLFFPAKLTGSYYPFLLAYFILTCGLSFLETSANPYILSMGSEETSTRRLNLAQAFNPIGSLAGMWVAMNFIQARLNPLDTASRTQLSDAEFAVIRESDLSVLITPYLFVGLLSRSCSWLSVVHRCRVIRIGRTALFYAYASAYIFDSTYRGGVAHPVFLCGCTDHVLDFRYSVRYADFHGAGMDEKTAEVLSQRYNIVAMILFCMSRFICTYLLKFFNPGKLLLVLAVAGGIFIAGVIGLRDIYGLYCLVAVSAACR